MVPNGCFTRCRRAGGVNGPAVRCTHSAVQACTGLNRRCLRWRGSDVGICPSCDGGTIARLDRPCSGWCAWCCGTGRGVNNPVCCEHRSCIARPCNCLRCWLHWRGGNCCIAPWNRDPGSGRSATGYSFQVLLAYYAVEVTVSRPNCGGLRQGCMLVAGIQHLEEPECAILRNTLLASNVFHSIIIKSSCGGPHPGMSCIVMLGIRCRLRALPVAPGHRTSGLALRVVGV
jgi:hypothetical protein